MFIEPWEVRMTQIKIFIDSDQISSDDLHTLASPAKTLISPKPIVLISTIKLTPELKQELKNGAGQNPLFIDGVDYDDLPSTVQTYDGANRLIVTTGGLIAFQAAKANVVTARFVSLLGVAPTGNLGRCLGGVTVSGFSANSARVTFLVGKGRARAGIGLFCNLKSAMNQAEEQDWATIAGVNQTIIHGGNTNNKNNASHYDQDFAQANGAGITTLIISADPFFFYTREKLISAANNWVAGAAAGTRYVCYPFSDYENAGGQNHPAGSWYGGSLLDAYNQIGVLAALQLNSVNPLPFTAIPDTSGDFP
jgi:hypothetical protein